MAKRRKPQSESLPFPAAPEAAVMPDPNRPAVKRRKPKPPPNWEAISEFIAGLKKPFAGGLQEAVKAESVQCPKCGSRTDDYGRCWACEDWVCRCGKLTGSVYISGCSVCTLLASDAT